ncbi:Flp pilus assembly protein CpaB [Hwanghaeella grinnelliae]|uniref:Flp pilus assembly protein CpaB n=1 Tax=Hwanghaeella grinnelliae TaxID=2500179 RepID=A0A3S2VLR1_9PROT|nr:Flp pilus assembly protein CpaB [Hwanghaeella grinnelliae]RVU35191.1 Flp pilus assembly protein CpaB [Hwanghaeella grinnelliae]
MRVKTIVLAAVAVGAAFGAATLARDWLETQQQALQAQLAANKPEPVKVETAKVLVARDNMPAGTFLKEDNVRWADWPKDGVAATYFVEEDAATEDMTGAVVRTGLTAGEPLTAGRIVRPGDRGFLAAVLRPGMRAISVPINATTGISGFIFPGDFVDLLLTQSLKRGEITRHASETVLREVRVLAVDQRVSDQEGTPTIAKTATLEVTPKQAEEIAVVMEIGRLSLALRSLPQETEAGDEIIEPFGPTLTWDSQVSRVLQAPPSVSSDGKPATTEVKVVRGSESQTLAFRRVQ